MRSHRRPRRYELTVFKSVSSLGIYGGKKRIGTFNYFNDLLLRTYGPYAEVRHLGKGRYQVFSGMERQPVAELKAVYQ